MIDAAKELETGESAAVQKLTPHWSRIFPDYNYSYNSERIKNDFITAVLNDDVRTVTIDGVEQSLTAKNYSDDFYKFNYFADLHLIKLYGDHPRNWMSVNETEDNALVVLTNEAD